MLPQAIVCRLREEHQISTVTDHYISVQGPNGVANTWPFDRVFAYSNQQIVYDYVFPFIRRAAETQHSCTIAAFGAENSGKSYTMTGILGSNHGGELLGLVPRTLQYLERDVRDGEVVVEASFVELFEDHMVDLINAEASSRMELSMDEVTTVRHTRQDQHDQLFETYLDGMERLRGRQTRRSLGTCFQLRFIRGANDEKQSVLRFAELRPASARLLQRCIMREAPRMHEPVDTVTQLFRQAVQRKEALAFMLCCGNESKQDVTTYAHVAQCLRGHAAAREPDASRISLATNDVAPGASTAASMSGIHADDSPDKTTGHISNASVLSGRQSVVADIFERKHAFYMSILREIRENEMLIQECHGPSRFSDEDRPRIKKCAEKSKSLQKQAMHAMREELCVLEGIMEKGASDENRSPEHAPEAAAPRGTTSYGHQREPSDAVIPMLPLGSLPKLEQLPGERLPYIVGPRVTAGDNESCDDESHISSEWRGITISPTSPPIPRYAMMHMPVRAPPVSKLNPFPNCVRPVELRKSLSTKECGMKLKITPISLGQRNVTPISFQNRSRTPISLWNSKVAPTYMPSASSSNLNSHSVAPADAGRPPRLPHYGPYTMNGKASPECPDFRMHNSASQMSPLMNVRPVPQLRVNYNRMAPWGLRSTFMPVLRRDPTPMSASASMANLPLCTPVSRANLPLAQPCG
eukprot:GEMP01006448.1.p1 GENE.GEMP01006448.1~~GEMP01006448.1.p1  ORF type:complete len:696 (+),score=106.59 GEMP01006448.1:454-2541(+)